ncbi:lipopolysaccharide biosynthesis protein [Pyrococcus yayanosii]|uniref:Polysaccharide biosynthesis protein C-terminal domain-containing protein n=1 Tax=Pyrococcus yayanosii (strain CH1 / JCM 16557) TaxID=529709 RepID=F8AEA0_PYRYC|nr:hypothetical protein [Pyrococcus yayanosii]AEH24611.1 hypothetical protein PYCH_09260 [Pyrococcus yayanosii CH1]
MHRRRIIIRHSLASVVALAVFGGSRFLYNVIIGRKFGLEVLGWANSLISQAFFLAGFLAFFSVALGKYTAEFLGRGERGRIGRITSLSFAAPLLGLLLAPLNFSIAFLSTLRAFQLTFRAFIYGLHRGEVYAYTILAAFAAFLLGFLLPDPLAPYYLLLGTVTIIAIAYVARRGYLARPTKEDVALLISYSSYAFIGTIAGIFLLQAPYFLTEKLAGREASGVVAAVLSASFLLGYLPQVMQSAIVPLYAYDHGKRNVEAAKRLAKVSASFIQLATAVAVFLMILVGGPAIRILFGFTPGPEFYVSLLAVEIYVAYNPLINLLSATAYVKDSALVALSGAVVAGTSWLLLIPHLGPLGAPLGLLAGYAVIFFLTHAVVWKKFSLSPKVSEPLLLALPLQVVGFFSRPLALFLLLLYLMLERGKLEEALRLFRGRVS